MFANDGTIVEQQIVSKHPNYSDCTIDRTSILVEIDEGDKKLPSTEYYYSYECISKQKLTFEELNKDIKFSHLQKLISRTIDNAVVRSEFIDTYSNTTQCKINARILNKKYESYDNKFEKQSFVCLSNTDNKLYNPPPITSCSDQDISCDGQYDTSKEYELSLIGSNPSGVPDISKHGVFHSFNECSLKAVKIFNTLNEKTMGTEFNIYCTEYVNGLLHQRKWIGGRNRM